MTAKDLQSWIRICFISLFTVALLGLLMRYKIAFSFPYLEQKHIQHAHSHFAFAGWISQSMLLLMIFIISKKLPAGKLRIIKPFLILNILAAWAMLFGFLYQGYGTFSITASVSSILISWAFALIFFKNRIYYSSENYYPWFGGALFFNIISSLGTFAMAYLMVNRNTDLQKTLGSLYFYLHFQYNGWFFFACAGIAFYLLQKQLPTSRKDKKIFLLLFAATIPAYFLSTLWAKMPAWLYGLTVLSAVVQIVGWFMLLKYFISRKFLQQFSKTSRLLIALSALAFTLKFLLQLGSVVPAIAKLAFGFRPIVIAYLHLVLLAGFTLFILGIFLHLIKDNISKSISTFAIIFAGGVFLNELILTVQGVAGFAYIPVPYVNEALFGAALIMFLSVALMALRVNAKKS